MSEKNLAQPEQTPDDALLDVALVDRAPAEAMWEEYKGRRSRLRWWLLGEREEPPVSVLGPVAEPDPEDDRSGICCSGGGVRSASFNLGALQAIQDKRRLQKTRFLSAVSGGSYIAAAFAMVAKTSQRDGTRDPAGTDSDPDLVTPDHPPFERWSPEEQYLRNRASYMAPTGSDKAYLVWRILLGLVINLLLIGAVVTLVAAVLSPYYRHAHPGLVRPTNGHVALGASPSTLIVTVGGLISIAGIALGIASMMVREEKHEDVRRFLELWSLRVFCVGLVVIMLEAVVPELIDLLRKDPKPGGTGETGAVGTGSLGVVTSGSVAAILAAIVAQLQSAAADPVKAARDATGFMKKLGPRLRLVLIYLAAGVFGPLVILAMLVVATLVQVETREPLLQVAIPAAAFVVVFGFMRLGDLNTWSLHPFYRRRLSTAFALRRVKRKGDPPGGRAEASPEQELLLMSKTHVLPQIPPWEEPGWPTLLVCAAANVSDPGAVPPGRGVTTFTFSDAEVGGPLVGGVVTEYFEQRLTETQRRDFTLPSVVAMSGAAVSPSMGKLTRPSVRFLMAMANVRLGVWVPNPRRLESFVALRSALRQNVSGVGPKFNAVVRPGEFNQVERSRAVARASARGTSSVPHPSPLYLLKELLGWNSINDKFLYVTDGGHYENLGLIELLRRGCRHIYCFDASGGRQLAQLGDAIALARSELGVDISFPDGQLERLMENEKGVAKSRCAAGTLTYMRSDPPVKGKIVYVPTVFTENLPWDVRALKGEDNRFPHHSTLDQLFTDQKFEAYRILGYCGAEAAMSAMDDPLPAAQADDGDPPPGLYGVLERLLSPR
jgi:MFS family permease